MAMVVNYYIDKEFTPIDASELALSNNHRTLEDGTAWSYFEDMATKYNLDFMQTYSSVEAKKWMESQEDPLIICSMTRGLWTSDGHFILLWDIKDDVSYINDPASESSIRSQNSFYLLSSQCQQFFCFNYSADQTITTIITPANLLNYNDSLILLPNKTFAMHLLKRQKMYEEYIINNKRRLYYGRNQNYEQNQSAQVSYY